MRFRGVGEALLAGIIFYVFAGDSVRLDLQSDTADTYKLFAYEGPGLEPVVEVRQPFEPFSSLKFPLKSTPSHLRLDLGEHTGLLRINRLCFKQGPIARRCFAGSALPPLIQTAHDVDLTPDGSDLIVVSKSNNPYLAFQPGLKGYPAARLASALAVSIAVFLLFSFPAAIGWAACAVALLWCGSNWIDLVRLTRQTYTPAPVWDYWRVVEQFSRYQRFDLSVLWMQHNEHRIVFPELAMAADALFLHAHAFLPLALGFAFQLSTIATFALLIWREKRLSLKLCCFTIILGFALIGWPGMAVFLSRPFLFAWLFTQIGVVIALVALPRSLPLAIAGGVIATYSTANGMLIWPVLILAAFALKFTPRRILILAASGVTFTGLYFAGYHPTGLRPDLVLQQPLNALAWVAAYLSLPFGFAGALSGFVAGSAGLLLFAAVLLFGRNRTPAAIVFQGAALFVVISAFIAAGARMMPGHITPSTQFDLRFASMPLFFWVSLLFAVAQFKWNWVTAGLAAALVAILFTAVTPWIVRQLPTPHIAQIASLALECGTLDEQLIGVNLERELSPVEQFEPVLRKNHLSIFSSGRFERLGKPSPFAIDLQPAQGAILTTSPISGGLELTGWTTGKDAQIIFLNENGAVLGFGESFGAGWTGFANLEMSGKSLRAYRVSGGKMAAIGTPISLPEAVPVSVQRMGQRITEVRWMPDPAWSESAISPQVGEAPYGHHWGTFHPNHLAGKLVSESLPAPPGNCIVIPVGHGPSVAGETVQIVDGTNQTIVATIPIGPADGPHWRLWRVSLPPELRMLKILAEDRATGEGQWLGLGEPVRCTSSYQ